MVGAIVALSVALLVATGLFAPTFALWMSLATLSWGAYFLRRMFQQVASLSRQVEADRQTFRLLDRGDVMIAASDASGTIIDINESARSGLGLKRGENLWLRFPDSSIGQAKSRVLSFLRDGEPRFCQLEFESIRDGHGKTVGYLMIGQDITERRARDEALLEKQQFIESVAQNSPTFFYTYDLETKSILYCNRCFLASLGFAADPAEIGEDPLPKLIHPEDLDVHFNRLQRCKHLGDGEVCETEIRFINSSGEVRWIFSRDVVFKRENGRPRQILVNLVDITDRKRLDDQLELQVLEIQDANLALQIQTGALEEANHKLEALAYQDGLTEIANHRYFQEELSREVERAIEQNHPLSVVILDVDHFKLYNDTYGHPSGDIVLRKIASILRTCCPLGCLTARYGGEEYALVCPNFASEKASELSERIRTQVAATPWPERGVTVSVGFATLCGEKLSASKIVGQADAALYVSKSRGRNIVTGYSEARKYKLAS